jgi:uncharacterized integral membrane protein
VSLLRLWLAVTAAALAVLAVWAFAPVLLFIALLIVGLGLLSAVMIGAARALQARRQRRGREQ